LEQIINGHRIVGHSGNLSGIRASLKVYVDEGISFSILSNFDRDQGAEELEYFIREKINGKTDFTETYLRTKKIIRDIETRGYSYCIGEYHSSEDRPQLYEGIIHARGHVLLRYREYDKAIDLFRFYTVAFPNSAYAHDGLGEAYVKTGNKDEAIKCYRRALEINPEFERSADALKGLGVIK
jgi:D-alanyl-D-alanine carboxypeptidase